MTLYCDMDGVLADFDRGYFETFGIQTSKETDNVDWALVRNHKDFFRNLPPMPGFYKLWSFIKRYDPIILTGIPSSVSESLDNKKAWIYHWLEDETIKVIGCRSKEKYLHAKPGDILIDDWTKYKHKWINVGGIWITHISADNTISILQNIIPIQKVFNGYE